MATASPSIPIERGDLLQAVAFSQVWFDRWLKQNLISAAQHRDITDNYTDWQQRLEAGSPIPPDIHLRPPNVCWSCKETVPPASRACDWCGAPMQNKDATALRYLIFLCFEVRKQQQAGRLNLAAADDCLADANARIASLRRTLDRDRIPLAQAVEEPHRRAGRLAETLQDASQPPELAESAAAPRPRPEPPPLPRPPGPRRNLMEILLDPRTIQLLLACGGALLALGLLIWLAAEGLFKDPVFVAVLMGSANAALLLGGWAVCHFTRHQLAGRALTLLACLVMPFNLWFYNHQNLITIEEGHLWVAALVCCALYAVSARLLRDPTFVYVLVVGVAGTGLLILADQLVGRFWEIGAPASLLVVLGLAAIHAERIFPEGDGPFSRHRFGLAFFWAGHAVLGAGLLLLLGAQIAGDWLYAGVFEPLYARLGFGQPEIVTTTGGQLLALALVLAGTYAYVYSDLVVRRVGAYIHLAVAALLWAEVLVIGMVPLPAEKKLEVVIVFLALTGLAANLAFTRPAVRETGLLRAGPALALLLSTLPVLLGLTLHYRATVLEGTGWKYEISYTYVLTMLVAALCCRAGAFLYRHERPSLSMTYFFGTAAATMAFAAGVLLVLSPDYHPWEFQAPILMVIPLLYLIAARLYRGHTPEQPLVWVAHAATLVLLISSIGATFQGFLVKTGQALNLKLALFFAEAALFYGLDAGWRKYGASIHACTAAACAAVWQLLQYFQVRHEYYLLTFALVGLALLIVYRFAVLERLRFAGLAGAAFQSANVLLSLAFVGGALLTLSELVSVGHLAPELEKVEKRSVLLPLVSALAVIALLAVALVRQEGWRRWYVALAITHAALFILVLAVTSTLTAPQKMEIVCVVIGVLLLVAGHLGWYREQEGHNDLVSACLLFGSVLVALPLTAAVVYYRSQKSFDPAHFEPFHTFNEIAMLAAGLVLLVTGFAFQIRSTTLAGGFLTAAYLVTLLLWLRIPEKLQTTAVYIMVGGGLVFGVGLLLSLYRDRLVQLPERIKRREGVFRVLSWR
jgi:hypothetical protein